ncbi:MAG: hypothetical protein ACI4FZ_09040 [Lachnospiraceae bacterium]
MDRERKLQGFLLRFLLAGTLFLSFVVMKLLPFCSDIVEEIFSYIATDIVFLR